MTQEVSERLEGADGGFDRPEDDVHRIADAIRERCLQIHAIRDASRQRALELTCEIGKLVLDEFFGGSMQRFRQREQKDASLRRLAELLRDTGGWSKTKLHEAVNIWEISTRLGLVRTCGHLGPSHVRTVIPLDEATQADFLARAEAEEWSVAKLQDMKESEARRGDGGSAPPATRFVRRIERVADEFDRIFSDLEDFQGLPRQQAEELHKALYRARERIDRRLARVQRALSPKRAAVRCGEAPAKARHGSGPPPAHPLTMALDGAATH